MLRVLAWQSPSADMHGIVMFGSLGVENACGLAMRRDRADRLGIATMADLAAHSGELALELLVGAIPQNLMQDANYRVDRDSDKETPAAAARWLVNGIGPWSDGGASGVQA